MSLTIHSSNKRKKNIKPNSSKRAKTDVHVKVFIPKVSESVTQLVLCPLTHGLMVDPVLAGDGFLYERSNIEEWIWMYETSPFLRSIRLSTATLVPVRKIREIIEALVEAGAIKSKLSRSWKVRKREAKLSKARKLLDAAKLGVSKAQRILARWYFEGTNGLEKDEDKCELLAKMAAKGGDQKAKRFLGYFYSLDGPGVRKKNIPFAIYWYEQASKQGCSVSTNNLATLYGGLGDKFLRKSFCWHWKSAVAGYTSAMVIVGKLLCEGKGVKKNLHRARRWLEKAVGVETRPDKYSLYGNFLLGRMMMSGEGGPADFLGGIIRISYSASRGLPCAKKFMKGKQETYKEQSSKRQSFEKLKTYNGQISEVKSFAIEL